MQHTVQCLHAVCLHSALSPQHSPECSMSLSLQCSVSPWCVPTMQCVPTVESVPVVSPHSAAWGYNVSPHCIVSPELVPKIQFFPAVCPHSAASPYVISRPCSIQCTVFMQCVPTVQLVSFPTVQCIIMVLYQSVPVVCPHSAVCAHRAAYLYIVCPQFRVSL